MIGEILSRAADEYGVDLDQVSYAIRHGTANRATILLYGTDGPFGVCRLGQRVDMTIEEEYDRLREVNRLVRGAERLEATIESPVALTSVYDEPILFTTYLDGTSGHIALRSGAVPVDRYVRSSVDWLIAFLRRTRDAHCHDEDQKRAGLRDWSVEVDSRFVKSIVEDEDQFLAPVHMDFTASNLFFHDGGTISGVIDYEFFSPVGLPWWDLISVITDAGRTLGGFTEQTMEDVYFSDTPLSRAAGHCLERFSAAFGFRTDAIIDQLPIFWGHLYEHRPEFDADLFDMLRTSLDRVIWGEVSDPGPKR